jgi:glycosyltransferase involved in cell wall biosynthesis
VKLLVLVHKPPPHHGESYMVQLLLDALGGGVRERPPGSAKSPIQCFHVDARYSRDNEDIGRARFGKVFLALKYAAQAIACRLRHGVNNLYYVPAFPARAPVWRDWIVLGLCRPFFKSLIYHWHTTGLGEWLEKEARPWERWLSRRLFGRPELSIVLRPFNRPDADYFESKRIEVVPNGVPDPCPQFEAEILPQRLARIAARKRLLAGELPGASSPHPSPPSDGGEGDARIFRVLFLSMCYSGKGLFDTVEAIALTHQKLQGSPLRVRLTVAGKFWLDAEQRQFEERIRQPDLLDADGTPLVEYRGFVGGADKTRLFVESDCLCFPTYMPESFGLVLVEGMAFGLPLITTNSRKIPEMLPPNPPGIVDPKSPDQISAALLRSLDADYDPALRSWFLKHYTDREFALRMRQVLASLEAGS